MQKVVFAIFAIGLLTAPALAEDAPSGLQAHAAAVDRLSRRLQDGDGLAEIAPGSASGAHTHPGIETGYVLEGEVLMSVEGQPDRTLKSGDSYVIPGRRESMT